MGYEHIQASPPPIQIEEYTYLVKRIASHMMARMPSSVLLEDMLQAGMVGLIEASQKYDATRGASFETYAGIRIRGAIVDEMRRGDWAPRSVHRNARKVAEAIKQAESRLGRDANDSEVAAELGVSIDEYHEIIQDCSSTRLFSFDELADDDDQHGKYEVPDDTGPTPDQSTQLEARQKALAAAIDGLPERERLVLSLYYEQEMNLKEIGLVLSVSESRVSQIHSQATVRLKARLADWL